MPSEQKSAAPLAENGDMPAAANEPEAEQDGAAAEMAAQETAAAIKKRVFRGVAQTPVLLQDLRRCARDCDPVSNPSACVVQSASIPPE